MRENSFGSSLNNKPPKPKRFAAGFFSFTLTLSLGWWFFVSYRDEIVPQNLSPVKTVGIDTPKPLNPRAPLSGQKIWLLQKEPIRFEWAGEASEEVIFEISREPDFRMPLYEEAYPVSPHFTDKLLVDGVYFWRLAKKNEYGGKQGLFPPVSFALITPSAPVLIYPFSSFETTDAKSLKFYWQEKKGVGQYRIQVAQDSDFKKVFHDQLVEEPKTSLVQIPEGKYFWRVRAEEYVMEFSAWSETRILNVIGDSPREKKEDPVQVVVTPPPVVQQRPVARKPIPPPIRLAVPQVWKKSDAVLLHYRPSTKAASPGLVHDVLMNPPVFSWGATVGAHGYELQVSKKSDFSTLEWTDVVPGQQAKWIFALPGKYFWRVRAVAGEVSKSGFSSPSILILSLQAPKVAKKMSQLLGSSLGTKKPSVTVSWENVPAATGYRVLVSSSKTFKALKLDINVMRAMAKLPLDSTGLYFVKVAALDSSGERVGDFSDITELRVEKAGRLAKSEKNRKIEDELLSVANLEKEPDMSAPVVKLPPNGVSIVPLNGQLMPISFKWQSVNLAKSYRLEIAKDNEFSQPLYSQVTDQSQIVINKSMPRGRLYWRLRAERGGEKSDWSETFYFEVGQ
ncbi:hypothetical protein [Bdellovibrio sp. HCB337]|uniref:hypothetical protein n=1 Tax=Bdellovibrio sp. HCB337 TaxID=3394358 RepID=UPI0039A46497